MSRLAGADLQNNPNVLDAAISIENKFDLNSFGQTRIGRQGSIEVDGEFPLDFTCRVEKIKRE